MGRKPARDTEAQYADAAPANCRFERSFQLRRSAAANNRNVGAGDDTRLECEPGDGNDARVACAVRNPIHPLHRTGCRSPAATRTPHYVKHTIHADLAEPNKSVERDGAWTTSHSERDPAAVSGLQIAVSRQRPEREIAPVAVVT